MNKEEKTTGHITSVNNDLKILKQNFPNCFDKNGNFDFEKFKTQLTANEINFSKESNELDWLGKSYARLLVSDETTTLLKEDESFNHQDVNEKSENLLIKGDNLEVLKHLSNAYYEKIKMIYIDPPYNTGSDGFVYADDRKFTLEELQELAGLSAESAKRILDFTQSKSNSHSAWLTFMYPRLYVAKQLLKEDGVIFVSIDDNEVAQLRLLMDDIFGEENFVSIAPRKTGAGSAATRGDSELRKLNDFIIIYMKSNFSFKKKVVGEKEFPYTDSFGRYYLAQFQASGSDSTRSARPNMYYPIYVSSDNTLTSIYSKKTIKEILPKKVNGEDGRWLWSKLTFEKNKNLLNFDNDIIQRKIYFDETKDNTIYQVEKAYFEGFNNSAGTNEVNKLFAPYKKIFSNPKPTSLLKHLIKISNIDKENDFILDFFAGSGTTGAAVMELNAEDGGNRKFILAQLPELIASKSNKTSYYFVKDKLKVDTPTIFDITKERLIRVSKKLQEENKDQSRHKFGFKIFETIPVWEDYNFESKKLELKTSLFDENKLTREDLRALLITWKTYDGTPLTETIQEIDLNGYTAYHSNGRLYLMNKGFKTENLKVLLEKIDSDKDFNPTTIIAFGYHFESKNLREICENIKSYANKKNIDIDFITRY